MSNWKKKWEERVYEAEGSWLINFLSGIGGVVVGVVAWKLAQNANKDDAILNIVAIVLGAVFACGAALILYDEKLRHKISSTQKLLLEKLEEAETDRIGTRGEVRRMFQIAEKQHMEIIKQLQTVALKDGPVRLRLMEFLQEIAHGMSAQQVPMVWHELVMSLRSSYDTTNFIKIDKIYEPGWSTAVIHIQKAKAGDGKIIRKLFIFADQAEMSDPVAVRVMNEQAAIINRQNPSHRLHCYTLLVSDIQQAATVDATSRLPKLIKQAQKHVFTRMERRLSGSGSGPADSGESDEMGRRALDGRDVNSPDDLKIHDWIDFGVIDDTCVLLWALNHERNIQGGYLLIDEEEIQDFNKLHHELRKLAREWPAPQASA